MDAEPVAIPEDTSVERALDEYFLRYRWPWFPVVDAARALPRPARTRGRRRRPRAEPGAQTVGEVFELDASGTLQVRDDAPLESLLGNDALRRLGGLAAVDADGRLRGVITADQVGRALRDAVNVRCPAATPTAPSRAPATAAESSVGPRIGSYRIASCLDTTYW